MSIYRCVIYDDVSSCHVAMKYMLFEVLYESTLEEREKKESCHSKKLRYQTLVHNVQSFQLRLMVDNVHFLTANNLVADSPNDLNLFTM